MCGFAGCRDLDTDTLVPDGSQHSAAQDAPGIDAAVQRMTAQLAHRGPDDQGHIVDGPVQLGFRRLSIIDLSGGHQPMATADGKGWLVFNGEIYNHAQLREQFTAEGADFTTTSDTEVVLTLCEREGAAGLRRLRGMFALAYWEARTGRLLLARDRFGIKPLYYLLHDGRLWFASEQRALAPLVGGRPDAQALEQYLRFQYVPEPATALDGVRAVPAGSWLEATGDGQIHIEPWWTPTFTPADVPAPGHEPERDSERDSEQESEAGCDGAAAATASTNGNDGTNSTDGTNSAHAAAVALVSPGPRDQEVHDVLRDSVHAHLISDASTDPSMSGEISSTSVVAFAREVEQTLRSAGGQRSASGPRIGASIGEPEDSILAVLRDSVRAHLIADVPVGAFLSGGVDSTTVVALAREVHPDLHTFSVGFEQRGYSELDVACRTAEVLDVPNTAYVVSVDEFVRELPRIVRDLDTLVADPAAIPLWFVAREARKHVKVVLSGEGADELFGGYTIYRQPWVVRAAERLSPALRAPLAALADGLPEGMRGRGLLQRLSTPLAQRYIGNARIFPEPDLHQLLRAPASTSALDVTGPLWRQAAGLDDATAMQHVDLRTWLVGDILVKADRMTMAHSLELRVPFLDPEVFAVAAGLSRAAKLGEGTTKLALRRAVAGIIPDHVLHRPKLGFPVPIRHWLSGDLHDWAEDLILATSTDLLDTGYALELLRRHQTGPLDLSRRIWTILVFCLWQQHVAGGHQMGSQPAERSEPSATLTAAGTTSTPAAAR